MKILFVFSRNDKACNEILKRIVSIPELKSITTPIDVVDPDLNAIVKNSTNVKLKELPAILVYGGEQLDVYEGVKSVHEFISNVVSNLQNKREEEEEEIGITSITDLGLTQDIEPLQLTPIPSRPSPQNMPIKSKRTSQQTQRIDNFAHQRTQMPVNMALSDNSTPSRLKITSPPMKM
jgi:hypothetical protein